jgi:peroxiredoxin
MLGVGDRIPDATVWTAPRETVRMDELVHEGPILLVFYLFDCSNSQ